MMTSKMWEEMCNKLRIYIEKHGRGTCTTCPEPGDDDPELEEKTNDASIKS